MSRPRSVPKLCLHRATGRAVVRLSGKDHYLGKHGTPEAEAEYNRLVAEWLARGRQPLAPEGAAEPHPGPSVNEVLLAFWRHAELHYRDADGRPTTELRDYQFTLRPVRELYGHSPAADFGPLTLKAVRQRMIDQGLSRGVIN